MHAVSKVMNTGTDQTAEQVTQGFVPPMARPAVTKEAICSFSVSCTKAGEVQNKPV